MNHRNNLFCHKPNDKSLMYILPSQISLAVAVYYLHHITNQQLPNLSLFRPCHKYFKQFHVTAISSTSQLLLLLKCNSFLYSICSKKWYHCLVRLLYTMLKAEVRYRTGYIPPVEFHSNNYNPIRIVKSVPSLI